MPGRRNSWGKEALISYFYFHASLFMTQNALLLKQPYIIDDNFLDSWNNGTAIVKVTLTTLSQAKIDFIFLRRNDIDIEYYIHFDSAIPCSSHFILIIIDDKAFIYFERLYSRLVSSRHDGDCLRRMQYHRAFDDYLIETVRRLLSSHFME